MEALSIGCDGDAFMSFLLRLIIYLRASLLGNFHNAPTDSSFVSSMRITVVVFRVSTALRFIDVRVQTTSTRTAFSS